MGEYFVGNVIFIGIVISVVSFVLLKFTSEVIGFVFRGVFGILSIFILNILLTPFNLFVGINFFTGMLSAFLGLPAIILMYGLALLFR